MIYAITNRTLGIGFFIVGLLMIIMLIIIFIIMHLNKQKKLSEIKNLIINGIKVDITTQTMVDITEEIWRLEKKITELTSDEQQTLTRYINRLKRELLKFGLEYNDYTSRKHIGINVEIIESYYSSDIKTPIISNTIKPEIMINGERFQKSQVEVTLPSKKQSYKIHFNTEGGNAVNEIIGEEKTIIEKLPNPTKENNVFLYWVNQSTREKIVTPFSLNSDLDLRAVWEEQKSIVEFPIKGTEYDYSEFIKNQNKPNDEENN